VPGAVEVAVVHGHERAVILPQGGGRLRGQRAHAVGGPEIRAAHGRHRQAGAAERALRHVHGRDAGGSGPLVDRGQRLPLPGIDPRIPAQPVEQPVLAGDDDLVAEDPVLARRLPGADRAEAGDRGGREPGRDGA